MIVIRNYPLLDYGPVYIFNMPIGAKILGIFKPQMEYIICAEVDTNNQLESRKFKFFHPDQQITEDPMFREYIGSTPSWNTLCHLYEIFPE